MSNTAAPEKREFQAEAKQLLHLMTHSLYSNREIFLRELVSNAADACDKLRFEALANPGLMEQGDELKIRIEIDEKKKTLSIEDNGIGMSRDEVIENIGTIARSGTARFIEELSGDQKKDASLIGQFGVGFYSAFIVANRVELESLRAGDEPEKAVYWSCDGEAEYEVSEGKRETRGTRITLHLKKDMKEFLQTWQVRSIVSRYSGHLATPVQMKNESDQEDASEWDTINEAQALWTRPRTEISDEQYRDFYRQLTHDFRDPLLWSHNRVEGKLDYTSLLYIPANAPGDLWRREGVRGLKLYIRRTFVLDDAEQFLPMYLRFVKGVLDSSDLPLNVSRELLQQSPQVDKLRSALTKRVLDMLKKAAKKDDDKWKTIWKEFGSVLKEGLVEEPENREKLMDLLRFATTQDGSAEQAHSLADYISRMPEGQDRIWYITGDSHAVVSKSPLLESFRKRGIEVLLLSDGIDEWLVAQLDEYEGKRFADVARGELEEDPADKDQVGDSKKDQASSDLVEKLQKQLEPRVSEVRLSRRLIDSPSCLVLGEHDMGAQMRRVLEASGQAIPQSSPVLEINGDHPLVKRLESIEDETRFGDLCEVLYDQARLASGEKPEDPAAYVNRINRLLLELP